MKKVILPFGIIAGIIVSVFMLLSMPLVNNLDKESYDLAEILGYVSIVLSLSTVFIAVKTYRDKHNDGKVNFGKAFLIGLYITLIAAGIYALVFVVYDALSATSFADTYRDIQIDSINSNTELSAAEKSSEIAEMDKWIEMYKNPLVKFFVTVMEYVPAGLIVSLIAAFVLKKK